MTQVERWPNEQLNDKWDRAMFDDPQHMPLYRKSVVLIGSYHAPFLDEMRRAASVFRDHDITVVHPTGFIPLDQEADFVVYRYDSPVSNETLQREANDRMELTTAILAICPGGRLGDHTKREVMQLALGPGLAHEGGVPLYFTATPRPTREQRESDHFDAEDWQLIREVAEDRIVDPQTLAYRILGGAVTRLLVYDDSVDCRSTPEYMHIADDLFGSE